MLVRPAMKRLFCLKAKNGLIEREHIRRKILPTVRKAKEGNTMTWVLLVRVFCLVLGFLSLYDICFMSFSSFLGGFVVLWQVCNSTGQRTPAIYQSNHCINASHTRTHTKTHSTLQLMRRWTFDLDIKLTHGQTASYWARPVNIDDGLEVIMWTRCLGGDRFPTASHALRPNLNKLLFLPRSSSE